MLRDGFGGVLRAGRIETAPRAKQRGDQQLVPPDHQQNDLGAQALPLKTLSQFGRKAFQGFYLIHHWPLALTHYAQ